MSNNWSALLAHPQVVKLLALLQSNLFKWLLMLALSLWITTRLASLFWAGVGFMNEDGAAPLNFDAAGASAAASAGNVDLAAIKAVSLFGEGNQNKGGEVAAQKPTQNRNSGEIPNDAPKTNLPLTLTGVISAGDSPASRAMIVHSREEATFKLEDKLPPNKQAILVRVLPDRVILDNAGRYESLVLYDEVKQASTGRAQPSINRNAKTSVADRIAAAKDRINSRNTTAGGSSASSKDAARRFKEMVVNRDAAGLSKAIKVSVAQKGGQIQGYRVSPGSEPQIFNGLGFKSGDIIKSINGTPLNDPSNGPAMMAEFSNASQLDVIVERGGKDTNLSISL